VTTIRRLVAPNPGLMTGAGTNTYLLANGAGAVAVIDPGPDDPRHLDAILAAAAPLGRITAICVTHGHVDHLPGAAPLAERLRAARPDRAGVAVHGHARLPGVEHALADGATLRVAPGLELVALETPGHTDDSLCYWDAAARALFTGDLVAGAGTVVVDDAPGGLGRYLASLARLAGLGRCAVYPGHGPPLEDGQAKIEEYLRHRARREAEVLAVLEAGPATVDRIVAVVYPDVPPGLVAMAARNVRAHLGKLRDEGRVRAGADGRWRLGAGGG
jgi:glyoxylase-like metal-dependent hydrolase (beta-lactamase superfamily II)